MENIKELKDKLFNKGLLIFNENSQEYDLIEENASLEDYKDYLKYKELLREDFEKNGHWFIADIDQF